MRLIILFVLSVILQAYNVNGQSDQEAIKILDSFSKKALTAPSISMKFQLHTNDQIENSNDSIRGSIILSKHKYKLDIADNIIWFNGETAWNYLPAEKEVTITRADKKDHSFQNRPSEIFSLYKKGFKCRLIEEKSDLFIIDMYPEDLKSELIRIRLAIGNPQMNLKSMEYKKKDGITITLYVKEYDLALKPTPSSFVFHISDYKGVEVIDMR
jgi:outer membrane lipoprotein carrier protein